jgi:DNA polymerase I-like protein with 3'-5' exonuclease and polymerase domains
MTQDSFGYARPPSLNGSRETVAVAAPEPLGLTLEQYAEAKRLPVEWLKTLNIKDATYDFNPAIRIAYPDEQGKEVYHRYRLALKAEPRFKAPPASLGLKPVPYGLQVLGHARDLGFLVVVEGESDPQILWYNDIPALGIPGTKAWKKYGAEWAAYTQDIPAILVPVEADGAGEDFWEMLYHTPGLHDRLYRMPVATSTGYKDIGDLWVAAKDDGAEDRFKAIVEGQVYFGKKYAAQPKEGLQQPKVRLLPTVSLKDITEEAAENQDFFVYPLFRKGTLVLFVGAPKLSGKTTLLFCAMKAMFDGEAFLGDPTHKAKVLYLSEQGNDLVRAMQTSGIDVEDAESIQVVQYRDIWREPWEENIESAVLTAEDQGREILVIDTFAAFSKLRGSEENDSGSIQERLEPLKTAAHAHGLAVLLVHHSGRDSWIRGSSAFDGTVDIITHLSRREGQQSENERKLTAIGRCEALNLNVELTKEGIYVPLGSDSRVKFAMAVKAIREHAPRTEFAARDIDGFVRLVKEGSGTDVSKSTIEEATKWLHDQDVLARKGEGVKGDPYKYWMPDKGGFAPIEVEETKDLQIDGTQNAPKTPGGVSGGFGSISEIPYTLVEDKGALDAVVAEVATTNAPVALDTETSSLAVDEAQVRLLQVRTMDGSPYLVDLTKVRPEALLHVLADKPILVHNSVYDLAVLNARYGYEHRGPISDTMLMFQVFYGGTNKKAGLQDALKTMLGVEVSKDEQVSDWFGELTPEMMAYAARDVLYLHDLREALLAKVEEKAPHLKPVVDLEHRMAKVTAHMSAVGMPVDKDVFAECVRESREAADQKLAELDALITAPVPEDCQNKNTKNKKVPENRNNKVNWDSPQQVLWSFKEVAGLTLPNTSKDTLLEVDHPMAVALMEYRKALDVYKRFREAKVVDGRVYARWNQLKARTGRMSCEKPPLQGIPEPLRRAFVAPEGKMLIVSDLSQIEIRVLATLCGDENLRADLEAGLDVHQRVAANVFGKAFEAVTKAERKLAKALVFGTLYGLGLSGFTARVNAMTGSHYTQAQVQEKFRGPLFAPYPKVQEWVDNVARDYDDHRGDRKTVSYTRLGRRRLQVPGVPAALNTPIQAGATDVMKAIAVAAYEGLRPGWEIVGLVHDEILLVVPEGDAPEAKAWLHEVMTSTGGEVVNQGVPEPNHVKVDAGTEICDTWAEKE